VLRSEGCRRIRQRRKSWRTQSGKGRWHRQQCQDPGFTGAVGWVESGTDGPVGGEPWCVTSCCLAR